MPYIDPGRRDRLDGGGKPGDAGELNYCVTRLMDDYLSRAGKNYTRINEVVGVLECAKQEFYRRIAGPYEDTKIAAHGDVYTT